MLKKYRLTFFLLFLFFLEIATLIYLRFSYGEKRIPSADLKEGEAEETELLHSSHFYDKEPFEKAFQEANLQHTKGKVCGGIIPHHLLASSLIASFFKGLEGRAVETVVLLGPNHRNVGGSKITLSKARWKTPLGLLEPDLRVARALLPSEIAGHEEWIFDDEHSIYGLTPFIKKTFPDARFLPLVLKSSVREEEARRLGQELSRVLGEKSLVLVSVDFTHEESSTQAEINDQEGIEALRNFSFEKIYSLKTDSNPSLYALLSYLEDKEVKATLLENSDSFKLSGVHSESVTSYVTMYFSEPSPFPALAIDRIFSSDHNLSEFSNDNLRTLIFTGDVLLARSVNYQIKKQKNVNYPFEKTASVLAEADLTFVNLESPFVENCPLTNEGMIFCGDPQNAQALVYAGVDIAALSNNHALDYGKEGLESTVRILEENKILAVGLGEAVIEDIRGLKFAFLGYDTVKSRVDESSLTDQIGEAKSAAGIVVVYFHWGIEYTSTPTQKQKDLAYLAIDSGADLVIASHPHWIQGIEIYEGKPIIYSLGNFIFDQGWSEKTKQGMVAKFSFCQDRLVDIEFLPVLIEHWAQPRFLEGEEKKRLLDEMRMLGLD